MRLFFASLVLANIAFAAWYYLVGLPAPAQIATTDPGLEALRLVDEPEPAQPDPTLTAEAGSARAVPSQQTATTPPPLRCYKAGLFKQLEQAEQVKRELEGLGFEVRLVSRYPKKVKFLVYLPAYPSYAEASKVTEHLKANGKHDFQILTIKGERNGISLGVYSQPDTAEERRQEIAALGYRPVIDPVYGVALGHELEIGKPGDEALTAAERAILTKPDKKIAIRTSKCTS